MIVLRSKDEIGQIRQAGKILARTLEKLKKHAKPGIQTKELDEIAREEIIKRNGYPAFKGYKGFPGNICTSVNETVVHGIPSDKKLRDGDIVSIDVGVRFRDYYADGAITVGVGKTGETADRLIEVTRKALYIGIENAMAGSHLTDLSCAIQQFVEWVGPSAIHAFKNMEHNFPVAPTSLAELRSVATPECAKAILPTLMLPGVTKKQVEAEISQQLHAMFVDWAWNRENPFITLTRV